MNDLNKPTLANDVAYQAKKGHPNLFRFHEPKSYQ